MSDRGSDFLLQRCKTPFSEDVLVKLGDLITQQGARVVGWECLGQPNPDAVFGVAHAGSLDEALGVIRGIIELDSRFIVETFPRGIPFPEFFEIQFKSHGR